MDSLVSVKEIEESGFKQRASNLWIKDKEKYIKCGRCHKWVYTREGINTEGKRITIKCLWCKGTMAFMIPEKRR